MRYFTKSLWLAVLISFLATVAIDATSRLILRKKSAQKALGLKEKEEAENMFLSLATSNNPVKFLEKLALSQNENVKVTKGFVCITHPQKEKPCERTILYPHFFFSPLSPDDITEIVKKTNSLAPKKIIVLCEAVDKDSYNFIKNFDQQIILLDKFSAYQNLYKPYNFYPEITLTYHKDKKLAWRELVAYSFNRSRTKGYVLAALFLLFSSLFLRVNLYYCISASVLLIFALFSQFNSFFNKKVSQKILD